MATTVTTPVSTNTKSSLSEVLIGARRIQPVIDDLRTALEIRLGDVKVREAIIPSGGSSEQGFLYLTRSEKANMPRAIRVTEQDTHSRGCACHVRIPSHYDVGSVSESPSGVRFLQDEAIIFYASEGTNFVLSVREMALPYLPGKKLFKFIPIPGIQMDGQSVIRTINEVSMRQKQAFSIKRV